MDQIEESWLAPQPAEGVANVITLDGNQRGGFGDKPAKSATDILDEQSCHDVAGQVEGVFSGMHVALEARNCL